jgi:hypothetical protein
MSDTSESTPEASPPTAAAWPSATFPERSWRWCGFGLWLVVAAKLWIDTLLPGWVWGGVVKTALLSAASLGLVTWFWQRRRLGVRVDDVGVHELFPGGRTVSHLWSDIRRIIQTGDADYRLYTTEATVRFTHHLDRVGVLAAAIRARLQGPAAPTESPAGQPSPEQVAAWLGVSPEELPLIFLGLGDWEILVVSSLTVAAFLITWVLGLGLWLAPILWWVLWGHFLAHPLPIRVELGGEGVVVVDLFGRRKTCGWMDLLRLRQRTLEGRYGPVVIPPAIEKGQRLLSLLRQAMGRRGRVPAEGFSPSVLISDAAISRARPPAGPPTATDRSLSRSHPEEEAAPHLTEAVQEQEAEATGVSVSSSDAGG